MTPDFDQLLDQRGSICPMPVIALAKAFVDAPESRVLLLTDDPAAQFDVPAWCGMRGRVVEWSGDAPDGHGAAFLIASAATDLDVQ